MKLFKKEEESSIPRRLQYPVKEAAVLFGFSVRKVYYLIAEGKIASYKIGGQRFITLAVIEAFVAGGGV